MEFQCSVETDCDCTLVVPDKNLSKGRVLCNRDFALEGELLESYLLVRPCNAAPPDRSWVQFFRNLRIEVNLQQGDRSVGAAAADGASKGSVVALVRADRTGSDEATALWKLLTETPVVYRILTPIHVGAEHYGETVDLVLQLTSNGFPTPELAHELLRADAFARADHADAMLQLHRVSRFTAAGTTVRRIRHALRVVHPLVIDSRSAHTGGVNCVSVTLHNSHATMPVTISDLQFMLSTTRRVPIAEGDGATAAEGGCSIDFRSCFRVVADRGAAALPFTLRPAERMAVVLVIEPRPHCVEGVAGKKAAWFAVDTSELCGDFHTLLTVAWTAPPCEGQEAIQERQWVGWRRPGEPADELMLSLACRARVALRVPFEATLTVSNSAEGQTRELDVIHALPPTSASAGAAPPITTVRILPLEVSLPLGKLDAGTSTSATLRLLPLREGPAAIGRILVRDRATGELFRMRESCNVLVYHRADGSEGAATDENDLVVVRRHRSSRAVLSGGGDDGRVTPPSFSTARSAAAGD